MHDSRDDPAFPTTYSSHRPGLTLRQFAALTLRVPDSGLPWMDEMIARVSDPQELKAVRAKQDYCDQQELTAVRELNRELAIPGMIGSPIWYDVMRRVFKTAPQPTEKTTVADNADYRLLGYFTRVNGQHIEVNPACAGQKDVVPLYVKV